MDSCVTGVLGCPRSCLHAILSLLQKGTERRSGPVLTQQAPHLAELCYQVHFTEMRSVSALGSTSFVLPNIRESYFLCASFFFFFVFQVIYQLCACPDTSGPTMRFLRTSQDFLFSHLQHLPFNLPGECKGICTPELFGLNKTDCGSVSSLVWFVWAGVNTTIKLRCRSKQLD